MAQKIKSISELNELIQSDIIIKPDRPKQLMDQNKFNEIFLKILNNAVLVASKGQRSLQITSENDWLFQVIMAYLNRNESDKALTYTIELDDKTISRTLDLNKGITLLGSFGVGKSLLLRCIYENRGQLGLNGYFVDSRQIFDAPKNNLHTIIGHEKCCLFIDDLGDEPIKSVDYGQEDAPVASVLKRRLDAWEIFPESPRLFISSNCGMKILKDRYGGRIISRIHGATNVIITRQSTDYRKI